MRLSKHFKFLIVGFLLLLALTSLFHIHHFDFESTHQCLACHAAQGIVLAFGTAILLAVFNKLTNVIAQQINFKQTDLYFLFFLRAPPAQA